MMNLLRRVLPKSMIAGFTFPSQTNISKSFFSTQKTSPSGVFVEQFSANDPIQDRVSVMKMDATNGYYLAVFDGHGGDYTSEYVNKNLPKVLQEKIKNNQALDDQQSIKKAITDSFETVEHNLLNNIKQSTVLGNVSSGSCALVALLLNKTLYVANAGDCEGIIVKEDGNITKVNRRLNIAQKDEQERLKKLFPGENDIAVYTPGGGCYLKGRLQPTYSLGDFYLKFKQFNFTGIKKFTGPYVQYKPEIRVFQIQSNDKYLVLATDGLWDEYSHKQVSNILLKNASVNPPGKHLLSTALDKISSRLGIAPEGLSKFRNRRNYYDDISLIVVDLQSLPR